VIVSINSDDAEEAQHLNQEAAKTMKYGGMTHEQAIKMVTINPAIQLGIDKRVGSIEKGKDADFVIYNHDPLSVYAQVQKTIIDGHTYFDRQKDLAMRADLEKEKKSLIERENKEMQQQRGAGGRGGRGSNPGGVLGTAGDSSAGGRS
jgi:adenine deaminase